ncbi:hypothetical protein [Nocardioides piscis]|uniref:Uncharacterized protein n=1 Tax=Nocardioides piscis TaxID=2714938 RepID=A0A6G7YK34_9ACTN|nr:hypothetical protein [Nocardioides piscis]QIK77102.1 hypothetical protein G7071_18335 [Nocardioides piscis]
MKTEHERPTVAFVLVSVLCALMLAQGIRSDVVAERLGLRDGETTAQPSETEVPGQPAPGPSTGPAPAGPPAAEPSAADPSPAPSVEVLGAQATAGSEPEPEPVAPDPAPYSYTQLRGSGLSLADLLAQ